MQACSSQPAGSVLGAQFAPDTYEIIKKSWWKKKSKKSNGNIFIDISALLKENISMCGGRQFI